MSVDCLLWRISHSEQDTAVFVAIKEFTEHLFQDDLLLFHAAKGLFMYDAVWVGCGFVTAPLLDSVQALCLFMINSVLS